MVWRAGVNIFDPQDFITGGLRLRDHFPSDDERVVEDREIEDRSFRLTNLQDPHNELVYLSSVALGRALDENILDSSAMTHIVFTQGRSHEFNIPTAAQKPIEEAIRWGLKRAGASYFADIPVSLASYTQQWRPDADELDHVDSRLPEEHRGEFIVRSISGQGKFKTMRTGTIRTLRDRGFGFIEPDGNAGSGELFFHHSAVADRGFEMLQVGQRVSFDVTPDPRDPGRQWAINVVPEDIVNNRVEIDDRDPRVNTGFAPRTNPEAWIDLSQPLIDNERYYFWLEVKAGLPVPRNDGRQPPLPVHLLPRAARLTVALFTFPGELGIVPGQDVGGLELRPDGSVTVAHQPGSLVAAPQQAPHAALFPNHPHQREKASSDCAAAFITKGFWSSRA